jgi:hypothetical protein
MFCQGVDWGSRYAGGDVIVDLVTWQPVDTLNSTDTAAATAYAFGYGTDSDRTAVNGTAVVAAPVLHTAATPLTVTAVPQFRSKSATEGNVTASLTRYYKLPLDVKLLCETEKADNYDQKRCSVCIYAWPMLTRASDADYLLQRIVL